MRTQERTRVNDVFKVEPKVNCTPKMCYRHIQNIVNFSQNVIFNIFLCYSNRMFIFHECWSLVTDTKICETSRRCLLKFLCVISRDMEIEKVLSCLRLCYRENLDNEVLHVVKYLQ